MQGPMCCVIAKSSAILRLAAEILFMSQVRNTPSVQSLSCSMHLCKREHCGAKWRPQSQDPRPPPFPFTLISASCAGSGPRRKYQWLRLWALEPNELIPTCYSPDVIYLYTHWINAHNSHTHIYIYINIYLYITITHALHSYRTSYIDIGSV